MKRITALLACCAPIACLAQTGNVIQDTFELAKVVSYTVLAPQQAAHQDCGANGQKPAEHNVGAAIGGGLVGALVGSRFGQGNGKTIAALAGAAGGAYAGDEIATMAGAAPTPQAQPCGSGAEASTGGYSVTYNYKGSLMTTILRTVPGEYIRIHNRLTIE